MPDAEVRSSAVADLADALTTRGGPTALLERSVHTLVRAGSCDCACVTLADPSSSRLVRVAAATGEQSLRSARWECEHQEGICTDAYASGELVRVDDLEHEHPWPRFSDIALELGHRSLLGVPLTLGDRKVGSLALFDARTRAWTPAQASVVKAMADAIAAHYLVRRELEEARTLSEQLAGALRTRIVVEQAKGMLAERHGLDVATAFERLRRQARSSRRSIQSLAADIVQRRVED